MLGQEERERVEDSSKQSTTLNRFGDGRETKSITIPMLICEKKVELSVEVVDNNICSLEDHQ